MDDRQFRETMERYARSTAKGREADFGRPADASCGAAQVSACARRRKLRLAALCTVLIVVVSLSVALPLTLGRSDGAPAGQDGGENLFYCNDDDITTASVASFDELESEYGVSAMRPVVPTVATGIFVVRSTQYDAVIGAFVELAVFDDIFDAVYVKVVKRPYVLYGLAYYTEFTSATVWRDREVRYYVGVGAGGLTEYRITFTADGYDYFIEFDSWSDVDAAAALETIYG